MDGYKATHAALRHMGMRNEFHHRREPPVKIRSRAYLNHTVEQDHRRIKAQVRPVPMIVLTHELFRRCNRTLTRPVNNWHGLTGGGQHISNENVTGNSCRYGQAARAPSRNRRSSSKKFRMKVRRRRRHGVRYWELAALFKQRRPGDDNRQRLRNLLRGAQHQEALPIAGDLIGADIRIHHQ